MREKLFRLISPQGFLPLWLTAGFYLTACEPNKRLPAEPPPSGGAAGAVLQGPTHQPSDPAAAGSFQCQYQGSHAKVFSADCSQAYCYTSALCGAKPVYLFCKALEDESCPEANTCAADPTPPPQMAAALHSMKRASQCTGSAMARDILSPPNSNGGGSGAGAKTPNYKSQKGKHDDTLPLDHPG